MSLETLNQGVGMVARSWSDLSKTDDSELDAQILVSCPQQTDLSYSLI